MTHTWNPRVRVSLGSGCRLCVATCHRPIVNNPLIQQYTQTPKQNRLTFVRSTTTIIIIRMCIAFGYMLLYRGELRHTTVLGPTTARCKCIHSHTLTIIGTYSVVNRPHCVHTWSIHALARNVAHHNTNRNTMPAPSQPPPPGDETPHVCAADQSTMKTRRDQSIYNPLKLSPYSFTALDAS